MFSRWASLLLFGLLSLVYAKSSTGDSVLVILDPKYDEDKFSLFFGGLRERGYNLTFRAPKDVEPAVIEYGEIKYSHVILFTPETKTYAKDITPQSLVTLLSKNTNLLIVASPTNTPLTSLAAEFSLSPAPPNTPLISHFPERDTPETVIPVPVPSNNPILSSNIAPVWFSGVPFFLQSNPLLVPILNAPPESFASDSEADSGASSLVEAIEKGGEGLWAGSQLGLVTGFRTLNGARATWAGSIDLFSDEYALKEISKGVKSGNQRFASEVAAWTFQESLVLRIDNVSHHRVNETQPETMYTTNDNIVYTINVSKYNPKTSTWEPYSGINDMQFEYTMLDPFIRTALPPVPGQPGKYSVTFRAPDRHGVFKFVVNYQRKGWTQLQSTTVVPLVPPRHDGYPRFISAAWPYYVGAISTSVGFILFSALWLSGDERGSRKGKSAKTD